MAVVSDIEIRLRADIARLQQDMTQARRVVTETQDRINAAANAMKTALAGIGLGAGLAKFLFGHDSLGHHRRAVPTARLLKQLGELLFKHRLKGGEVGALDDACQGDLVRAVEHAASILHDHARHIVALGIHPGGGA